MEEAGVRVDSLAVEAPLHAALARAAVLPARHGGAFLCGHTAFRAMAGGTPFLEDLCGEDAVRYP